MKPEQWSPPTIQPTDFGVGHPVSETSRVRGAKVDPLHNTRDHRFDLLDSDTKNQVSQLLKKPTWDGELKSLPTFEVEWSAFLSYWSSKLDERTLPLIFCTCLPKAQKNFYVQLHQQCGWTYAQIYQDVVGRGRGLHTNRVNRTRWVDSTPPKDKAPHVFSLWLLEWKVLGHKAGPTTPTEQKEVFVAALTRAAAFKEELEAICKAEAQLGQLLSWESAAKIVEYELQWKANRDSLLEGSVEVRRAQVGHERGRGKGGRGQGKGASNQNPPGKPSHVGGGGKDLFQVWKAWPFCKGLPQQNIRKTRPPQASK